MEVFSVTAGVADDGSAAGVGRVLENGVEPLLWRSLSFGFLVECTLMVAVDEHVFDFATGDELVDEPESFFDIQVIAADVMKTIIVRGRLVSGIGDIDVAASLV